MTDFIDELRRSGPRPGAGWGRPPCGGSSSAGPTATPDAVLAHEDTGQELTFAGYRDACLRAAAGLLRRLRGGRAAPA